MHIIQFLLLPFSWLYSLGVRLRNWMYDAGILKSYSFKIPTIAIGNLSTGGTGKTPMAEYVLQLLLEAGYKPALLSRGYGRKTKGYQLANSQASAETIGDEPYQVFRKFSGITVAVCEDRVEGIRRLQRDHPEVNVIVLDDAFQHRRLKAGFYILLTDYNKPYFRDFLLPSGRLREPVSGRKRADVIIMTKCPHDLQDSQKGKLKTRLKPHQNQNVYFTRIQNSTPEKCYLDLPNISSLHEYSMLVFSGIANPKPFINYVKSRAKNVQHINFPDHHPFSQGDIEKIAFTFEQMPGENKIILTTEKDWCRLESSSFLATRHSPLATQGGSRESMTRALYYLPVSLTFDIMEKRSFDLKILDYVGKNTANGRLY